MIVRDKALTFACYWVKTTDFVSRENTSLNVFVDGVDYCQLIFCLKNNFICFFEL